MRFIPVVNTTTVIDGVQPIEHRDVMGQDLPTSFLIKLVQSRQIYFENEGTICNADTSRKQNLKRHISRCININQRKRICYTY